MMHWKNKVASIEENDSHLSLCKSVSASDPIHMTYAHLLLQLWAVLALLSLIQTASALSHAHDLLNPPAALASPLLPACSHFECVCSCMLLARSYHKEIWNSAMMHFLSRKRYFWGPAIHRCWEKNTNDLARRCRWNCGSQLFFLVLQYSWVLL